MKDYQAGGYVFEYIILELLKKSKYIKVIQTKLRGRGAEHQIDAVGIFSMSTPFIYPIRLICEAKHYKGRIGLTKIRSFLGVIKDISENYFVKSNTNKKSQRYNDVGCFFSKDVFTQDAQNYAWAHNIFLVSFKESYDFNPIISEIELFLSIIGNDLRNITIKELLVKFKGEVKNYKNLYNMLKKKALIVATLNERYPIIFVGTNKFIAKLKEIKNQKSDIIEGTKTHREDSDDGLYTVFDLCVLGEKVKLSLPRHIADKIIKKISKSLWGQEIFRLDIPITISEKGDLIRRIFRIKTSLS